MLGYLAAPYAFHASLARGPPLPSARLRRGGAPVAVDAASLIAGLGSLDPSLVGPSSAAVLHEVAKDVTVVGDVAHGRLLIAQRQVVAELRELLRAAAGGEPRAPARVPRAEVFTCEPACEPRRPEDDQVVLPHA